MRDTTGRQIKAQFLRVSGINSDLVEVSSNRDITVITLIIDESVSVSGETIEGYIQDIRPNFPSKTIVFIKGVTTKTAAPQLPNLTTEPETLVLSQETMSAENTLKTLANALNPLFNAKTNVDKETITNLVNSILAEKWNKDVLETINKIKEELASVKPNEHKIYNVEIAHAEPVQIKENEILHAKFFKILALLQNRLPVFLTGYPGTGKTAICEQLAKALNLPFYSVSVCGQTNKFDILGYMNATGQYTTSFLRMAYENGGVILFDEIDAGNSNVNMVINSILANGLCGFPDNKMITKHKDFIFICAGNTKGHGGTLEFCGRNRIDGATLDRFVLVDLEITESFERAISGATFEAVAIETLTKRNITNQDKIDLVEIVQGYRKRAEKLRLPVIISPRASKYGCIMLELGFTQQEVKDMVIFKGLTNEVINQLENN